MQHINIIISHNTGGRSRGCSFRDVRDVWTVSGFLADALAECFHLGVRSQPTCEFPSAMMKRSRRVLEYEIPDTQPDFDDPFWQKGVGLKAGMAGLTNV